MTLSCYEDVLIYAESRLEFYQNNRKYTGVPNIITTRRDLKKMATLLSTRKEFAFDTETTGLRVVSEGVDSLVGISISWGRTHTYYIACGHTTGERQVNIEDVVSILKPIFEKQDVLIASVNGKFDQHVLYNYGINIRPKADTGKLFDSMRASWRLDENGFHGLKELSGELLGVRMLEFDEISKLGIPIEDKRILGLKANQRGTTDMVSIDIVGPYALDDAYMTWRLYKHFKEELKREDLYDDFISIDIPFNLGVLFDMEREGIKVDLARLTEIENKATTMLADLENDIYTAVGYEFNINSSQQLSFVLFQDLEFPVKKVTESGGASADKDVIDTLCDMEYSLSKKKRAVKIVKKIRDYRRLTGIVKFIATIRKNLYPDGKIHANFKQLTVTGRLSCSDINLQNQPDSSKLQDDDIRKDLNLRDVYVADNDKECIIAADFSNLELRILAHYSDDENLVDAFRRGQDVHSRTALMMFIPDEAEEYLKKDPLLKGFKAEHSHLRFAGKTLNFALIYGMQPESFAAIMSKIWKRPVSIQEAEEMYGKYFSSMSGVKNFIHSSHREVRQKGYVTTVLGRKRRLVEAFSSRGYIVARAERQATNSIIQGSAADIVVVGQLRMSKDEKLKKLGVVMLIQVHDEVVFKCPKKNVDKAMKRIAELMSHPFAEDLDVDLVVEPGYGKCWSEAKS